jgi:hypothetical protein
MSCCGMKGCTLAIAMLVIGLALFAAAAATPGFF